MDYDTVTVQILSAEPSPDAPNVVVDRDTFGTFSVTAASAPADATPQAQGQQLYKALFTGEVATALEQAWGRATGDQHGLRLRIQSNVAAVMALPWEYLYDDQRGFWAQNPATPIVRYLPFLQNIAPLTITLPLRVLAVLASPTDAPTLALGAEWNALTEALTPLQEQGVVEVVRLTPPTLEQLRETLIASPFHIVHFVGHGAWADDEGALLFELADGSTDLVKASRLAATLKGYTALRLAVLNACEGAAVADTGSVSSVFNGVAQRLAQQSALTVVAMQFPIADRHACGFAEQWYRAVAAGWNVDAALAEGRKALLDDASAWAAPVLYMRAPSGVLFEVPPPDPQKRITYLAGQADMIMKQRNWAQAIRPLERILEIDPTHAETLKRLQQARDHVEVETTLYPQLLTLMEAQQWQEAFLLIERIDRQYPSYKDVAQRRALVAASLKPVNPDPPRPKGEYDDVYDAVVTALQYGELVPFLGGNAALSGRMPGATWDKDAYLPSYTELATHLATALNYRREGAPSLVHVAQYGSMMNRLKLYGELDRIFSGTYSPTPLHRLLAEIPSRLAALGYPVTATPLAHHFIIVSVAYDTLMERAFEAQGQPYHLLVVTLPEAMGQSGNLVHTPPGGPPIVIQDGNSYDGFATDTHPVLLKLVGDRPTRKGNVVITEDQFIDYDALHRLRLLLPSAIKTALLDSSFLFLGYALQEWQLRLVLHRLGTVNRASDLSSWTLATQLEPWEEKIWDAYRIAPVSLELDTFVDGLREWLGRMSPA